MKTCCRCKTEKPLNEFYKNKSTADGLSFECKKCVNDRQKKWRDLNRVRINEYFRKARASRTKEQILIDKEKTREKNKKYLYSKKNWEKIKSDPVLLEKKRKYQREDRKRKFTPKLLPKKPRSDKQPLDVFFKKRRDHGKKSNELLVDSVVKGKIVQRTNIDRRLIPKELIELKRLHIQIGRKLKELKV